MRATARPRRSTGSAARARAQGDELAALIYLRLALILRPDHDLAAVTVANLLDDIKQPKRNSRL